MTQKNTPQKITITKQNGQTGVLTLAADGKYDISIDGKTGSGALHYTIDQLGRIIDNARAEGSSVEIEL